MRAGENNQELIGINNYYSLVSVFDLRFCEIQGINEMY